jgi:hypothetical protein
VNVHPPEKIIRDMIRGLFAAPSTRSEDSHAMETQSSTFASALFAVVVFAVVFPIFWALVIGLISYVSGWQRLAQRYRATIPPTGKVWRWQRGQVGWARYNGVLTLTTNDQGLFMETFWLFGFGHPRLFIPWHEIREAKVTNYFFQRQVKAQVGFPSLATVRLPAAVFEQSEGKRVLTSE